MGKQIDFDPLQKEVSWLAPFMIGLSLVCAVDRDHRADDGFRRCVHRPVGVV